MATPTQDRLLHALTEWVPSPDEQEEIVALQDLIVEPPFIHPELGEVPRHAARAPRVLNEAYDYPRPVAFSRGLRVDLGPASMLFISGTASIDENGKTVHLGDFRAQCWRTYRNISALLRAEGACWKDVVRCTCYLRDIERDYHEFNRVRTTFFSWLGLDPLPASVGIQARLCREDLLVEIEALAIQKARS